MLLWAGKDTWKSLKTGVLQVINEECRICNVAKYHDASLNAGDGTLGKEQPEEPKQNAGACQYPQVQVSDSGKV